MATPLLLLSRDDSHQTEFQQKLLYFAPPADLPQPLPTEQEIHGAIENYMNSGGGRLVRVGCYMVKYGSGVSAIEGENMLFVHRETTIPVPTVYAIWSTIKPFSNIFRNVELQQVHTYIVMKALDGSTLWQEWDSLIGQQKDQISIKLLEYMNELRAIPSPGYYGSIGRCGLPDFLYWSKNDTKGTSGGPFENEQAFNEGIRKEYIDNCVTAEKAEFYRQALPVVFQGHAPVFTHGDFHSNNIMIKRIPPFATEGPPCQTLNAGQDTFEVSIIDWECSGWYPTYWEYAMAMEACSNLEDDWHQWVGKCMEPFCIEFSWMQMLRNERWS